MSPAYRAVRTAVRGAAGTAALLVLYAALHVPGALAEMLLG